MTDKMRFKGELLGKQVVITSSESQAHMKAVFDLANQQLNEMKNLAPKLKDEQLLTLLAINALSDQVKMQAEKDAQAE